MTKHIHFSLRPYTRGFHIVTNEVLEHLGDLPESGVLHLFIQHTSAGLTINENADPDVLVDFETFFNKIAPEHMPGIVHTMEGPDDMPAHIKSSLVGSSISIPIENHNLALGTWQGIYLCEFRNHSRGRKIVGTVIT
jgi:secondary thiamine-phosphate synthase enzyme